MTPTQNFENYPEFANAGQKSQPNDAKYAAGFIPSDVLPAEWLNWFLNGATKGVTALNTGVKSVEQEINAVLESRSVPPDINAAGQLLSVLNKIKEEAINEAWPVGITYVQYPQQKSPQELFPKTTWQEISYDGAFFRASGGNAAGFIEKSGVLSKQESQNKKHEHSFTPSGTISSTCSGHGSMYSGLASGYSNLALALGRSDGGNTVIAGYNEAGSKGYVSANSAGKNFLSISVSVKSSFSGTRKSSESSGGDELRPENYTIRIWKRTA